MVAVSAAVGMNFKNGLSGKIVSASNSSVSNGPATIYTTPATGHFILTRIGTAATGDAGVCSNLSFAASNFGPIRTVFPNRASEQFTASFTPGIALPASSTISCAPSSDCAPLANPTDCYITGVLEK